MVIDIEPGELSPKQQDAIIAMLDEPTLQKAARRVDVSDRTTYRWLREPEFARIYRRCRREVFSHAISLTQRFAPLAVNTLAQVLTAPDAPASAKVAAAAALLRFGRESIEVDEVAARVEALEEVTVQRKVIESKSWAR